MNLPQRLQRMTAKGPMQFVIVLMLPVLAAGCSQTTPEIVAATAIEKELCIQWRDSLPTRSRQDTPRTQQEIGYAYDVQGMACPRWARFPN